MRYRKGAFKAIRSAITVESLEQLTQSDARFQKAETCGIRGSLGVDDLPDEAKTQRVHGVYSGQQHEPSGRLGEAGQAD